MITSIPVHLARARNDLCQRWRAHLLRPLGAVEVVTPVLHARPDIAPVRQFATSHPTTGEAAYLRIAPTEYLKRLLAGGHERVFEFSTNVRDDLPDETHLPEFTSLEVMAQGATCADMERVAVDLCALAVEVARRAELPSALPPWVRQWDEHHVEQVNLADELSERFGVATAWLEQPAMLARVLGDLGEPVTATAELPALLDQFVTAIARRRSGAVLVCGFPERLGGPAAPHPTRSGFKQRSELFVDGLEVANMSSNLVDGRALRRWHERGVVAKADLGIATNHLDNELLTTLDGALPQSAVLGIGIERMLQATLALPDIRVLRH